MYKVIIAEDDHNQRRGLLNIDFDALNMEVVGVCDNGEAALYCHREQCADIIITDIRMPKMNGIEFLEKARSISRHTRFLVVSGFAEFEYAHKAIELGVSKYLLKPFTKREITEALAAMVDKDAEATVAAPDENGRSAIVNSCMSLVRRDYEHKDLNLKSAAAALACSYTSLSREFQKQVGSSFSEYLSAVRIDRSKTYLNDTDMKIYQVADRVGLSQKNFNRLFLKIEGMTPSEFRRRD